MINTVKNIVGRYNITYLKQKLSNKKRGGGVEQYVVSLYGALGYTVEKHCIKI